MAGPRIKNEQIIIALENAGGMVTDAAKQLGMNRSALSRRIHGNKKLKAAYEDICESRLDLAETELQNKIKKGDITSIIFFLKCKGKHRGYVERMEIHEDQPMPERVEVEVKDARIRDGVEE
jgi:hypothetical protein